MIKSKKRFNKILEADRIALGKKYKKPRFFADEIWKYQIALRKH